MIENAAERVRPPCRVAGQALRPAQPRTVRAGFPAYGDRPGRHQRWTRTRVVSPVAGRGAPRCWYCRPARDPDRRPLCRPRTATPAPATHRPRTGHAPATHRPRTGHAWVPWRIRYCPLIREIMCYTNSLKSNAERFCLQFLSLRQSHRSGHSFSGPDQQSETRRTRSFPAICPNHGHPPRSPFWAVFRLSPPPFL